MKKIYMIIFFISFFILFGIYNISLAAYNEVIPYQYKPLGENDALVDPSVDSKVAGILGGIRNFGLIVSVVSLIVIGIRTMIGSVEEKSVYKEALPGYLVGLFLFTACTVLPNLIFVVSKEFNK